MRKLMKQSRKSPTAHLRSPGASKSQVKANEPRAKCRKIEENPRNILQNIGTYKDMDFYEFYTGLSYDLITTIQPQEFSPLKSGRKSCGRLVLNCSYSNWYHLFSVAHMLSRFVTLRLECSLNA